MDDGDRLAAGTLPMRPEDDAVPMVVPGVTWPEPVPLDGPMRPPFPLDAIGPRMRQWVEAVSTATQTPPDMAAMLSLGALAVAVAKKIRVVVEPGGWGQHLNLFVAVAMEPAERKSAVFGAVFAPLREWEANARRASAGDIAVAMAAREVAEDRLTAARKAAAKGGRQSAMEMEAEARALADTVVPEAPLLMTSDATAEALTRELARQGGRMAVVSDEGGPFALMAGRYSSTGAGNYEVYLHGHSGDALSGMRIGRESWDVREAVLSVVLAVQSEVIRGLSGIDGARGRGLLARFLFAMPTSRVGRRVIGAPPVPPHIRSAWERQLTDMAAVLPLENNSCEEIKAHTMDLTDEARRALHAFEAELEPRLPSNGDLGELADWGGKLAGTLARIAGLLHLSDVVGTTPQPWTVPVSGDAMQRAIVIGRYLEAHAVAAFGRIGEDSSVDGARYALEKIQSKGLTDFNRRDALRAMRRFKRAADLEGPLAELVERGYLRATSDKQWTVSPHLVP